MRKLMLVIAMTENGEIVAGLADAETPFVDADAHMIHPDIFPKNSTIQAIVTQDTWGPMHVTDSNGAVVMEIGNGPRSH
jgi:hypothetical protein